MRAPAFLALIAVALCSTSAAAQGQELLAIEGPDIRVLYTAPALEPAAREVIERYPSIRQSLETVFLWEMDFTPQVVLVGDRRDFVMMAGHDAFVAFAVPENQLVVVDAARMGMRPFTPEITLKHELCHLLLHRHISGVHLPKWLDEGICQWISEGIPEIVLNQGSSPLPSAVLTGTLIPLESLNTRFPRDRRRLSLAYEQSRSVVEYIIDHYGFNAVLNILQAMKGGIPAREAIRMSLMTTLGELETRWRRDLRSWPVLLAFFAGSLYSIIFLLAAVLSILAYIRFMLKRRRYREQEEQDPEHGEDEQG